MGIYYLYLLLTWYTSANVASIRRGILVRKIRHDESTMVKQEPQEWYIDRKKGISKEIRPMTKEERERAKEREEANNGE